MKNKSKLTEGSIKRKITKQTLTMLIGMLSLVVFNIVDTIFVGRLGIVPLAAMSFTFPVVLLINTVPLGLGVGASSVISRAIGSNDHHKTKRLTTDSLILAMIVVVIVVIIGLLTMDPLFRLLGAKENILPLVKDYMFIWYLGVPFVIIPMVGNNAIRAAGNMAIPSAVMLTSVIVNVILDPVLIFGWGIFPAMGLKGAAIATVIARSVSLVVSLSFLKFKMDMITTERPLFSDVMESWKKVFFIGTPAAFTQAIMPLAVGIVTRIIAVYGVASVAAFGIVSRIDMFALSPLISLSVVMVPFIGQNSGANKMDRIEKGINFAWIFAMILGFIMYLCLQIFGEKIGFIFSSDKEVISHVYTYLKIVPVVYGLQGVCMLSSSVFSALYKPLHSSLLNIIRMFVFYVSFAWIGSHYGLSGIFIGMALSLIPSSIIAVVWIKSSLKKLKLKSS